VACRRAGSSTLGKISAYPSDSSDALQVQNGDPLGPRVYNIRAPPLRKDSANRERRGAGQLCPVLSRERKLNGDSARRFLPHRLGEPKQQSG
jgi:hypothetical protein